ncbi:LysR family transcriptional regulator [Kiloniella sp.]|uniref:LysR family transcriptional regulator n=1 Tax=Kiloniella sp. TaxID=1938587 RepID=UPI003B02E3E8
MDLHSVRTFLTLVETHNFRVASEQLNLTKSAVSARIKQLEQVLQVTLFQRGQDGVHLTPAGKKFYHHAMALKQCWEKAQKDVRLGTDIEGHISLGIHSAMAEDILLDWQGMIRQQHPHISVHGEADYSTNIVQMVANGLLDIGVIYIAETRPGLSIERLFDDQLVLVSTDHLYLKDIEPANYLYLDWGSGYTSWHAENLPKLEQGPASLGLGSLGLNYLQKFRGSAYLPARLLRNRPLDAQINVVKDAPSFKRSVYVTYPTKPHDKTSQKIALKALNEIVHVLAN